MRTKKENEYILSQIKEIIKKKIKTFTKEYIDNLHNSKIVIIPLIALERKKQINLGRVELLGKNVKEIYYDKELSVKSTIVSETKEDSELYTERPEKVDDNIVVLKKRNNDTHLN